MIQEIWPAQGGTRIFDRAALRLGILPGWCVVCGRPTVFRISSDNFRENVICGRCGSFNRQRQMAVVLMRMSGAGEGAFRSVRDLPEGLKVWSAEADRALHEALKSRLPGYLGSEFLGAHLKSGQVKDGVTHVDIQKTHFDDDSLDVVLTSDVFEHVPDPYRGFREIYRVLKPGGCHIFTVPFYMHCFGNENRVELDESGKVTFKLEPMYHGDPVRTSEGALVYNIFGIELMSQLEKMGYETSLLRVYSPFRGILGDNGLVVVTKKPASSGH